MLTVAILAGGLATRLRPLTERLPKVLMPVAGRPFVFHQLDLLKRHGVERVVMCVGHLGEEVRSALGDGRHAGIAVRYSHDGAHLLGTGGAIRKALPMLGEEFFVLNGDSYLRCSLEEVESAFRASRRPALMTVLRNENRWDRSNVAFRDGTVTEYDKGSPRADWVHIDFGLSVLNRGVFDGYAAPPVLDLADVFRDLCASGRLAGHEVHERFYEIGSARGLRETEAFLEQRADAA
jgi:N-acetyl-alpha-D-muramate 1-phosphate uridylyltransferase